MVQKDFNDTTINTMKTNDEKLLELANSQKIDDSKLDDYKNNRIPKEVNDNISEDDQNSVKFSEIKNSIDSLNSFENDNKNKDENNNFNEENSSKSEMDLESDSGNVNVSKIDEKIEKNNGIFGTVELITLKEFENLNSKKQRSVRNYLIYEMKKIEKKNSDFKFDINLSIDSGISYEDLVTEFLISYDTKVNKNSVTMYKGLITFLVGSVESLNEKFDPFNVDLEGITDDLNRDVLNHEDFDEIFSELLEKYNMMNKLRSPEMRLLSIFIVFISKRFFSKDSKRKMDDFMKNKSDKLREQRMKMRQNYVNQNNHVNSETKNNIQQANNIKNMNNRSNFEKIKNVNNSMNNSIESASAITATQTLNN